MSSAEWIDSDDALRELCAHLRDQPWMAVDTEFHRERTYYAQLALVQIGTPERVACVDPLADLDLGPLDEVMLDRDVLKVMHSGRQDLEVFYDRTGEVPGPVFDTQVAASLVGRGDQLGYGALVQQVTGDKLDKLHGRTDWMRRPLDAAVLEYAVADVTHLRDVYLALERELEGLGRRAWLDEEQEPLTRVTTFRIPEDQAWTKLKGAGRLKGPERVVAQYLAGWREARAREVDRPRRRVVSDDAITDLARQRPKRLGALDRMRSIDPGLRKKHGDKIIELIAEASEVPEAEWPPSLDKGPGEPVDPAVVDALSAVLQTRAAAANISAKVLTTRSDLERLAGGDDDVPVMQGWRRELAGDALARFLAGELTLTVAGGALRVTGAEDAGA